MTPLVAAAADYLALGLKIIALTGKTPNTALHRQGLNAPITGTVESDEDWATLREYFEHPETTGIGILTSWPFIVVDIDGEEGAEQWAKLLGFENPQEMQQGQLIGGTSWLAKTGRGLHLWFLTPIETGTIKLGPKLDLKGEGGYVAAPPSQHPDGHMYEWLLEPGEGYLPPPAPAALVDRIAKHVEAQAKWAVAREMKKVVRHPAYEPGDTILYAQYGHGALIDGMKKAEEGNRNAYLHWAAAAMAEEGGTDEDFEELSVAALAAGLEPVEVRRTIRSGRRRGGG